MRPFGAPEVDVPLLELWACNQPVLDVLDRMPWLPGPNGVAGLAWAQLEMVLREVPQARKRVARKELPELLRCAENWVLEELAEQRSKQKKP